MPNPFNPQDYNRFAYVRNNPVRYVDPTGHICVQNGGGLDEFAMAGNCNGEPKPNYDPSKILTPLRWTPKSQPTTGGGGGGLLGGASGGSGGVVTEPEGPTTIQLAQDGISGLYLTTFPEGSTPSVDRTPEQLESAEDWAALGLYMDLVEGVAIAYPGDLFIGEYVMSAVDIGVTGRSCYLYGQCYIGSPDPSLPPMLVINQDIIVTGTDFVVPIVGGAVTGTPTGGSGFYPGSAASDVVTTGASFFYDLGRITGEIPNGISVGFTLKGDWYILVYPP